MQVTCWCFGAFSLGYNVMLKGIPPASFRDRCPDLEGEGKDDQVGHMLATSSAAYKRRMDDIMSAGA